MKIEDSELDKIKESQKEIEKVAFELGVVDLQIHTFKKRKDSLLSDFEKLNSDKETVVNAIREKYGEGNLNLQSGEFTLSESVVEPSTSS